jgi:hypothetical protein
MQKIPDDPFHHPPSRLLLAVPRRRRMSPRCCRAGSYRDSCCHTRPAPRPAGGQGRVLGCIVLPLRNLAGSPATGAG